MSIELLKVISKYDLPLFVHEVDEILGVTSLLEGGLIVGCAGVIEVTRDGRVAVVRPALIRDVTALGKLSLRRPDARLDALGDLL